MNLHNGGYRSGSFAILGRKSLSSYDGGKLTLPPSMSTQTLNNYLRMFRKSTGLSLKDMADLLGFKQVAILRHEQGVRSPDLETVIGYQLLFSSSLKDLFPGKVEEVEKKIMKRVTKLIDDLNARADYPSKAQKLTFLRAIVNKFSGNPVSVPPTKAAERVEEDQKTTKITEGARL